MFKALFIIVNVLFYYLKLNKLFDIWIYLIGFFYFYFIAFILCTGHSGERKHHTRVDVQIFTS